MTYILTDGLVDDVDNNISLINTSLILSGQLLKQILVSGMGDCFSVGYITNVYRQQLSALYSLTRPK